MRISYQHQWQIIWKSERKRPLVKYRISIRTMLHYQFSIITFSYGGPLILSIHCSAFWRGKIHESPCDSLNLFCFSVTTPGLETLALQGTVPVPPQQPQHETRIHGLPQTAPSDPWISWLGIAEKAWDGGPHTDLVFRIPLA
jgi:hypothetical protein